MANTININIKNCCCCGGGSGGAGAGEIVPIEDLPDPLGDEGPPDGYGEPSTLEDRQCKAAVFLYYWIYWMIDSLVNTTPGTWLLTFLNSAGPNLLASAIITVLSTIIGAALGSIATAGPDISDVLIGGPLGGLLGGIVASYILATFRTNNITLPLLEDALTKIPNAKDQIICKMAQGKNSVEVYAELEKVLAEESLDLSFSQRKAIFALIPPQLVALLYWSADWWPSFEDETLASITETCCGLLEPGLPLPAGTDAKCNAANYMLDQLIELVSNTQVFVTNYINFNIFDVVLDLEGDIYDHIKTDLTVPTKIKESAFNLDQYYRYIAKYMAAKFFTWNPAESTTFDTTFEDLTIFLHNSDHLIVCALYNATNTAEAFAILHDEIKAWLNDNVTELDQNAFIETAINGIINPGADFMNLLFVQDSDLVGYTNVVDCETCTDCQEIYVRRGSFVSGNTYTGELMDGNYYLIVRFWESKDGESCGNNKTVELLNPVGVTLPSNPSVYKTYRLASQPNAVSKCTNYDLWCDHTLPIGQFCVKRLLVRSSTQFTIDIVISGDCTPP